MTFPGDSQVHNFASCHEPIISAFDTLDQVAVSGLHVTLQGIGFTDTVRPVDIDRIVAATQIYCSRIAPLQISIGPADVDEEGLYAPVEPIQAGGGLRAALRQGIADVWGTENVPEHVADFRPHLTLAYSNGAASISDIKAVLQANHAQTIRTVISTVSLIDLNRDRRRYEWSEVATARLGR